MSLNSYIGRWLGARRRRGDPEDQLPARRSNSDPGQLSSPDTSDEAGTPPPYSQLPGAGELTLDSAPMAGTRRRRGRRRRSVTLPLSDSPAQSPSRPTATPAERLQALRQLITEQPSQLPVPQSERPDGSNPTPTDSSPCQLAPPSLPSPPPPRRPRNPRRSSRHRHADTFGLPELPGSYPLEPLSPPSQQGSTQAPLLPLRRHVAPPTDVGETSELWKVFVIMLKLVFLCMALIAIVLAFMYGLIALVTFLEKLWQ